MRKTLAPGPSGVVDTCRTGRIRAYGVYIQWFTKTKRTGGTFVARWQKSLKICGGLQGGPHLGIRSKGRSGNAFGHDVGTTPWDVTRASSKCPGLG